MTESRSKAWKYRQKHVGQPFIFLHQLVGLWKMSFTLKTFVSKYIFMTDNMSINIENALEFDHNDLTSNNSTLGQVMAWCHRAPSHYLNQWLPTPCSITRPKYQKKSTASFTFRHLLVNRNHQNKQNMPRTSVVISCCGRSSLCCTSGLFLFSSFLFLSFILHIILQLL